ncbi:hypothetical protein HG434_002995 [Candidatus Saccharibacteria bacterium]|nr:hypothetical protein [Candidatus Saccharibacteria bacterium]
MSAGKVTLARLKDKDNAALNYYMETLQTIFCEVLDRGGICSFLGKIAWASTERGERDYHSVTPDEGEHDSQLVLDAFKDARNGEVSFGVLEIQPQASKKIGRKHPDCMLTIEAGGENNENKICEYLEGTVISDVAYCDPGTGQWKFNGKLRPPRRTRILGRVANLCGKLRDFIPNESPNY